jgi:ankyrin repeat protein
LARGADPNGASAYGKRPLHFCLASANQRCSLECAELLLAAGADPAATSRAGKTAWASIPSAMRQEPAAVLAKNAQDSGKVAKALDKVAYLGVNALETAPTSHDAETIRPRNRL